MTRDELAHVLRAAATIVDDGDILVIGSQAILGSTDDQHLPHRAVRSVEADLAFFDDPDESKSDAIDGSIGEGSAFHSTYGYYAQGVSLDTAVLPAGWRERLIRFTRDDALPSDARCLDAHDLVVAKLVADRQKDREFATSLIEVDLVHVRTLLERVDLLDVIGAIKDRVRQSIRYCAASAGCG